VKEDEQEDIMRRADVSRQEELLFSKWWFDWRDKETKIEAGVSTYYLVAFLGLFFHFQRVV